MAERPIICSAPMVRALLREIETPGSGKTQTRRLAWRLPPLRKNERRPLSAEIPSPWHKVQPGDVLWVRETFGYATRPCPRNGWVDGIEYRADASSEDDMPPFYSVPDHVELGMAAEKVGWRPAIHMPRWAARITLDVTAVRVERLQAITPEDAKAEGDKERSGMPEFHERGPLCHVDWFRSLWTDLHGPDSWDTNPEVVVLTFTSRLANKET